MSRRLAALPKPCSELPYAYGVRYGFSGQLQAFPGEVIKQVLMGQPVLSDEIREGPAVAGRKRKSQSCDSCRPNPKTSKPCHGCSIDPGPGGRINRHGLPRDGRPIDGRLACHDLSIHGDPFSRTHNDSSLPDLSRKPGILFQAAALDHGGLRGHCTSNGREVRVSRIEASHGVPGVIPCLFAVKVPLGSSISRIC